MSSAPSWQALQAFRHPTLGDTASSICLCFLRRSQAVGWAEGHVCCHVPRPRGPCVPGKLCQARMAGVHGRHGTSASASPFLCLVLVARRLLLGAAVLTTGPTHRPELPPPPAFLPGCLVSRQPPVCQRQQGQHAQGACRPAGGGGGRPAPGDEARAAGQTCCSDASLHKCAFCVCTLQVWDLRSKKLLMDLPGHADEVFR